MRGALTRFRRDDKIYNIKLMGKIFRYSSQNFIMLPGLHGGSGRSRAAGELGDLMKYALSQLKGDKNDPKL